MTEIIELINYLNSTGGIPLTVTTTSTTNYFQFFLLLLFSSIFAFFIFGKMIFVFSKGIYSKICLRMFRRRNNLGHIMVVKHTVTDLFSQSMINQETLRKVQDALIKFEGKNFDLVLWTPGGEIFSATYISRMLRKYSGRIRSFVPIFSMSGGTLLALSTDEIYMNDYSCLGAIDPQISNFLNFGSAKGWKEVIRLKKAKANDQSIIMNLVGKQYTKSIRENIKELLSDKVKQKDLNKVAELLTSGEIEHAFNLTKDILRCNGVRIGDIPDKTNIELIKLIKNIPEGVTYV